ncbi:MAG: Rha family transcriptional regulator [Ruminococcus sp.]|nr:Rha family transcriptional regulator [Ruminococcus sp.]
MEKITINNSNGKLTVSSIQVAKDFGKRPSDVHETIENLTAENSAVKKFFTESTYINERGRAYKCYEMTKDGFSLLVMGFTGKKALEWKLKYIEAFNFMEQKLYNINNHNVSYEQLSFDDELKYEYFDKTYKGEPVLTVEDISHIIGVKRQNISYHLGNRFLKKGCDYYTLRKGTLLAFKKENPKISDKITCLNVVVKSGFVKLCEILEIEYDIPKCYCIEEKEKPSNEIVAKILKDFGISRYDIAKYADYVLPEENVTATGNSVLLHGKGGDKIFYDSSSGTYEKIAIIMQNIGYMLLGGFRESIDGKPVLKDEIHDEAKIFSAVFLALKLFADYGGFDANK